MRQATHTGLLVGEDSLQKFHAATYRSAAIFRRLILWAGICEDFPPKSIKMPP